jgi:endonuclease/exonuclease/phosphatase family metal-dependent hydrolase
VATLVATAAVAAAPSPVGAENAQAQRRLTVATYNLYLGADLAPVLTLPPDATPEQIVAAAAAVYGQVVQTDFPARTEIIARETVEQSPVLIGLQEVALWETGPPGALTPSYDFLEILLAELEERGATYQPVAINTNFTGTLPIGPTTLARLTMRDVILARSDLPASRLKLSNPFSANFQAKLQFTIGGQTVDVLRGWSSVDAKYRGKSYRFVNTHLEAFHPVIRVLQAQELVAWMAGSPLPIVLAGDLNTLRGDMSDAYGVFIGAGFVDGGVEAMPQADWCVNASMGDPGCTAGQDADLMNFPSELDHVVDYVMHNLDPHVDEIAGSGEILGEEVADFTPTGLWPSDHAGVSLTLEIAKP